MSLEKKEVVNRKVNIDVVRGMALFLVVVYHIWVLTGSVPFNNVMMNTVIMTGGEFGVTLFLLLSGYGIYYAIQKQEQSGRIRYFDFLKKRMIRVGPEYYLSILIIVLFSSGAVYLSKSGLKDIILHVFFIHNVGVDYVSTINPVLWTMAVIVQFYIIAIPMYKLLKKTKWFFPIIFIVLTIGYKYIMFHNLGYAGNFWTSRETLISVIDNFALGMFAAWISNKNLPKALDKKWVAICMTLASIIAVYFVEYFGLRLGIHSDNISGYIWHSVLAVCACIGIFFYSRKELFGNHIIKKGILWISKYEYGIYIVHLVIIQNLIAQSSIFIKFTEIGILKYSSLLAISVFAGWVLSKCADGLRQSIVKKGK